MPRFKIKYHSKRWVMDLSRLVTCVVDTNVDDYFRILVTKIIIDYGSYTFLGYEIVSLREQIAK